MVPLLGIYGQSCLTCDEFWDSAFEFLSSASLDFWVVPRKDGKATDMTVVCRGNLPCPSMEVPFLPILFLRLLLMGQCWDSSAMGDDLCMCRKIFG